MTHRAWLPTLFLVAGLATHGQDLPSGVVGSAYLGTIAPTAGTAPFQFELATGQLPTGLSLAGNGGAVVIQGVPVEAGIFPVTIRAIDQSRMVSLRSAQLRIAHAGGFAAFDPGLPLAARGVAYNGTLGAVQAGGAVAFDLVVAGGTFPPGLVLQANGAITGTPLAAGVFDFTVRAVNGAGLVYRFPVRITVSSVGLQIATTTLAPGIAGVPYTETIGAIGGQPPYAFGIVSGTLPRGMTFGSNGSLTGIPEEAGNFVIFVRVVDGRNAAAQARLTLAIDAGPLRLITERVPSARVGIAYRSVLVASGGLAPYTFSIAEGMLPAGLNLTASGAIEGVSTSAMPAVVTVAVRDANGSMDRRPLVVNSNATGFAVEPPPVAAAVLGRPFRLLLPVTNGSTPYSFRVSTGNLPPGLSLNGQGEIFGTPTATGDFTAFVEATDGAGAVALTILRIAVRTETLELLTSLLPNGRAGVAYTASLVAVRGAAPYEFRVVAGELPSGLTLSTTGSLSGIPTTPGTYRFTIRALDQAGAAVERTFLLFIDTGSFNVTTLALPAARRGAAYNAVLLASGGALPFRFELTSGVLPNGLSLSANGLLAGIPVVTGAFPFSILARDQAGASAQASYVLFVNEGALTLSAVAPPAAAEGVAYRTQLSVTGGIAPYRFTLLDGVLPVGLRLQDDGLILGIPALSGVYPISIEVRDSSTASAATARFSLVLTVASAIPRIVNSNFPDANIGIDYFAALQVVGGRGPYRFLVNQGLLPPGLSLSTGGVLSGTALATGLYSFSVRVIDAAESESTTQFTIAVNGSGSLRITTGALTTARRNQPYEFRILAVGGRTPYFFTLAGGSLPAGLQLTTDGELRGTPTERGSFPVLVRLRDGLAATVETTLTLDVIDSALDFSLANFPTIVVGQPFRYDLLATGGVPGYSFSVVSGVLPAGISLNTGGELLGTPLRSGSTAVVIRVVDAQGATFQREVTFAVTANVLAITNLGLPRAFVGQSYAATLLAAGGTPPYTFTLVDGVLPPGLRASPNGEIIGLPEAVAASTLTFRVVDAANRSGTTTLSLEAVESTLRFGPFRLPPATAGLAFRYTAEILGGVGPFRITVPNGLPPGLSLSEDGEISGVPSRAGSYNVLLRVVDSQGAAIQANIAFIVGDNGYQIQTLNPPVAVVNQPYEFTLAVRGGTAPMSYRIGTGALPPGLALTSDGRIFGAPNRVGVFAFRVVASDAPGRQTLGDLAITVVSSTLRFAATTLSDLSTERAVSGPLPITGGLGPYQCLPLDGILPDGLVLRPDCTLQGIPSVPGTFRLRLRVTDAQGQSLEGQLTFEVAASGRATIASVRNAASLSAGPIAPGELLRIEGTQFRSTQFGRANPEVTFAGIPATLVSASETRLTVFAPFTIADRPEVELSVRGANGDHATTRLAVVAARPGIFTNAAGVGAWVQADGIINSAANPAPVGSVGSVYLTGGGLPVTPGVAGLAATVVSPLRLPVTATIGSLPATVLFAGQAPGLAEGIVQVNLELPRDLPSGPNRLQLRVGAAASQEVVVFVR